MARDAYVTAGGQDARFASWWASATTGRHFDNIRALVGLAWEAGALEAALAARPLAEVEDPRASWHVERDAAFEAWWARVKVAPSKES